MSENSMFFFDAISKFEDKNVKFSSRKPTISKQKSIYICNLQVRMRKKHFAQGGLPEGRNPGKVRYLFIRNNNQVDSQRGRVYRITTHPPTHNIAQRYQDTTSPVTLRLKKLCRESAGNFVREGLLC